jgi:hypothetical protein
MVDFSKVFNSRAFPLKCALSFDESICLSAFQMRARYRQTDPASCLPPNSIDGRANL